LTLVIHGWVFVTNIALGLGLLAVRGVRFTALAEWSGRGAGR
jgi:hypothetical protein